MRRNIIIISIVGCALYLFLSLFFFLLGGIDGVVRLIKGDPAAPPVLDVVSRLLFVVVYIFTNKYTLKNNHVYEGMLTLSLLVGAYMIYDLCFEWSYDGLGHTKFDCVDSAIVSMMLPFNVFLYRLLIHNSSKKKTCERLEAK